MVAFSHNIPSKSQRPSAKVIPSIWVQLPDIHPSNVLFLKDKLTDGLIFLPVTIAPSLNMPRPSAKIRNPLEHNPS
jgi:hypothetical protein